MSGAEISLTAQLLFTDHYSFPLKSQELEFSGTQRLITAGQTESLCLDREEGIAELVGDWEVTVELAETVTALTLCVWIPRCRIIRQSYWAVDKVPLNEAVLIQLEGLSGIYMALIVATIDVCDVTSSSNPSGLNQPVFGKSPY